MNAKDSRNAVITSILVSEIKSLMSDVRTKTVLRAFDNSRVYFYFKDDAKLKLYPVLLHCVNGKSHQQIFLTITHYRMVFLT